jgi:hypothetical protein
MKFTSLYMLAASMAMPSLTNAQTFYTRPGTVTGAGVATMQFGTVGGDGDFTQRKLRGSDASRALQTDEAASGDFDVNFQIASNDFFERNYGASSSLSILALVGRFTLCCVIELFFLLG